MLRNLKIETKLNITVFLALSFVGFFFFVNYFTLDTLRTNIVNMTSKELLIKNTSNEIMKKLFIINNLVHNSLRDKSKVINKDKLEEIHKDILLDIEVIYDFANKYQKKELLKNITNIKLRYQGYSLMTQNILSSNITNTQEIVEIEIAIASVVDKIIEELDILIFLCEKDFTNRLFVLGNIIDNNFLTISILLTFGILVLLVLNTLFKYLLMQSIKNLNYTTDHFISLLDGKYSKENYTQIVENNEIGKIIQQMNSRIPIVKANILKLNEMAIKDTLTGLYNRRYLEEHTPFFISKAKRNKTKLGVLLLDVDYFKMVNDTYGHDVGDVVLQSLSKLFLTAIRESDMLVRYGGEEFVIILSDCTNDEDILNIANKINRLVQQTKIFISNELILEKTVSIGISVYPEDGQQFDTLLKKADEALYKAKYNGRNQSQRIKNDSF